MTMPIREAVEKSPQHEMWCSAVQYSEECNCQPSQKPNHAEVERTTMAPIARELRICAKGWETGVRLVGNVKAVDIVKLCDAYLEQERELDGYKAENFELITQLAKFKAENQALQEDIKALEAGIAKKIEIYEAMIGQLRERLRLDRQTLNGEIDAMRERILRMQE